jgi:hypothetical protein
MKKQEPSASPTAKPRNDATARERRSEVMEPSWQPGHATEQGIFSGPARSCVRAWLDETSAAADRSMTTHDLIGLWSAMHGYHSVMEDEQLMFRVDGSGWYEFARPWYSEFVLFSWLLEDQDRIRLQLHSEVEVSEQPGDEFLHSEGLRGEEVLEFQVAASERPLLDGTVRELHIAPSFIFAGPFAFARRDEPTGELYRKAGLQQ